MNFKHGFDDEFRPKDHKAGNKVRSIGLLALVTGLCWIAASVVAGSGKQKRQPLFFAPQAQGSDNIRQIEGPLAQPRDPFMVVAPAKIDPRMVVTAPAGIDQAMVFNPESRGQSPAPGALLVPLPGAAPGQVPGGVIPLASPQPAQPR